MNSEEKSDEVKPQQEELTSPESPETTPAEAEPDMAEMFEDYKEKRLDMVKAEAESVLETPELEGAATRVGYDAAEFEDIKQETGVEKRLEENQGQVETLENETREKIEEVRLSTEKGEVVEGVAAPQEMAVNPEVPSEAEKKAESSPERREKMEKAEDERAGMFEQILTSQLVSGGLDLVPIAGGGKMALEALVGKTLSGKELHGKGRLIHLAVGVGSAALDLTGIGEVEKGALLAGKGVGLLEKIAAELAAKGVTEGAKIFEVTAKFLVEHPQLTKQAEAAVETQVRKQVQNVKTYNANYKKNNLAQNG
jgi:hypothetical protein